MEHQLTDIQQRLLKMMIWFDKFCRDNHLTYYLMGGTLLGAMRHQGFIPWDDDLDVGMPRKDYEALIKVFPMMNTGKYILETANSDEPGFCYPTGKLYDSSTTLIEHLRHDCVRGLYIDIFPIDGMGNTLKEAYKNYKPIKRLFYWYMTRTVAIRKQRSLKKNLLIAISRIIPDFILQEKKLRLLLEKKCSQYMNINYKYVGNLYGDKYEGEIVAKDFFGTPKEVLFEGVKLFVHEQPENYLEHIYGDWRKLPPKEKQVSHHDFVLCDLEHSYFDYSK